MFTKKLAFFKDPNEIFDLDLENCCPIVRGILFILLCLFCKVCVCKSSKGKVNNVYRFKMSC